MIHQMTIMKGLLAIMVGFLALQNYGASAQETSLDGVIEEVVVYSIRQSLESALAEKRNKSNLTEIINADDIGKLPDENVAEVLENIPGVQITRDGGIGSGVSIRGSDQNRVEINGRGTTPSADNRGGISFADLPASLVRSLNVVKVPTADMVEGSLGGTINVKTYRGLKLKKPIKVIRLTSEFAENADHWNENFSATLGNKFTTEQGDIGAILTLSHINKSIRQDMVRVGQSVREADDPIVASTIDLYGGADFDPYFYPGYAEISYGSEERENTAISGSLEWQYSPALKFFVEGSYTDYSQRGRGQLAALSYADHNEQSHDKLNSDREMDGIDEATWNIIDIAGINVPIMTSGLIGGGVRNGQPDLETETKQANDGMQITTKNIHSTRETESHVFAFGGEWLGDNLEVIFEVSGAGSETSEPSFVTIFQYNNPEHPNFYKKGGQIRLPMVYDGRDARLVYGPDPAFMGASQYWNPANGGVSYLPAATLTQWQIPQSTLLDPSYYILKNAKDNEDIYENELFTQKIDFSLALDHAFWTDILFGLRASQRSNLKQRSSEQLAEEYPQPGFTGQDLIDAFPGFMSETPGNLFDQNGGGQYFDKFLTASSQVIIDQRQEVRDFLSLETEGLVDPEQGFEVEEDTYAAYLRSDFESELRGIYFKGNIGLRVILTEQSAFGQQVISDDNSTTQVTSKQSYTEALPSASLIFSPRDKIQLRLGFAEILRRPDFSQLSPTIKYPLNQYTAVRVGNPDLKPTKADQYDLSLEYYFRKGSVLSIGYFYKDIDMVIGLESSRTCNPRIELASTCDGSPGINVQMLTPVNLNGGTIEGFEVAFQHNFKDLPEPFDGLGMVANYAYQDGDRDYTFPTPGFLDVNQVGVAEFPLNFTGLSETSYNLTVYFEKPKYPLSGRIRYTYRDAYLLTESSEVASGKPLYSDDRGQLNASLSYEINDTFSLTFSAVNITKERVIQRGIFSNGPIVRMGAPDRRFALGIRGRF